MAIVEVGEDVVVVEPAPEPKRTNVVREYPGTVALTTFPLRLANSAVISPKFDCSLTNAATSANALPLTLMLTVLRTRARCSDRPLACHDLAQTHSGT